MRKYLRRAMLVLVAVGVGAPSAFAQSQSLGGCVDSPENPSVVLGLLVAVVAAAPLIRSRLRSRAPRDGRR